MDYKDTLKMPKTDFPMRGNLGVKEVEIQERWDNIKVYERLLERNKDNEPFILHDGPPYANNDIHIGHAFQKVLKDFVLKYKTMKGFYTNYVPGYDTHGLPIENEVIKKGYNRKTTPIQEFREVCAKYALAQVEKQNKQFKRLGILGDFDNPYMTLSNDYEADQIRVFGNILEKGLIYRGLKPVYWSPSSESAFAEAEIEYKDVTTNSIYLIFPLIKKFHNVKTNLLVWTTTPWTLPGNVAISVNSSIIYSHVKFNKKYYICASNLLTTLMNLLEVTDYEVINEFSGDVLEYLEYTNPINERHGIVILGSHVTETDGTGLVHTAPGHGEDDYKVGKLYNLEVLSPVDSLGRLDSTTGKYENLFFEDANKVIISDLVEQGYILKVKPITHSYPHDWRTHKPVIFRSTPQWFCSIESLKETLLSAIKTVKWIPSWGELRLSNMISSREDWVISRQRIWGVPIPIIYNEDNSPITDINVILGIADKFEKNGSGIWYTWDAKDLLPEGYTNEKSPNNKFTKEKDIMDVWFDSGTSYKVLSRRGLGFPADLYLEGSDQYRGWFNSSLITSVATTNKAPYKTIVSHGFVLDGNGLKMSKSVGNTIDPLKIINKDGADLLRLWVSSVYYNADVRISNDMLTQIAESYRKIRNTFKFILGNLFDFDPSKYVYFSMRGALNRAITIKCDLVINECLNAYENYEFDKIYRTINPFIINELSSFYLDITKDILYIEDSFNREAVQSTLYDILINLLTILTPIIPHTTSEAYQYLNYKEFDDVLFLPMLRTTNWKKFEFLTIKFDKFFEYRKEVLKALELSRENHIIGKSLEAHLDLVVEKELYDILNSLDYTLPQLFIVSSVNLKVGESRHINVTKKEGVICSRCWNIVDEVDSDSLCPRCREILKKKGSVK